MSTIKTKTIIQLVLTVIALAVAARVQIDLPLNEAGVPITGQSYAVLTIAALLGRKLGPLAVFFYLLVGVLGVPVFADGAAGLSVLSGGSAGYLYGFVVAAFVAGWLADWGWGKSYFKGLLLMSLGTAVILIFGLAWLTYLYGWDKALEYGFYPFWIGALIKIVLGMLTLKIYYHLTRR